MFKEIYKRTLEKLLIFQAKKRYSGKVFSIYAGEKCKNEFEAQRLLPLNERYVEYGFVFNQLSRICPSTVLDVGTGITSLPHLIRTCGFVVTAIDNIKDYWSKGMLNRHFHVIDDDITNTKLDKQFDFITCVSVLEHIKDHKAAMKGMFSLLKPGGYLVVTCPYTENNYSQNVYELPGSSVKEKKLSFITQSYSRAELNEWILLNGGKIIEQQYWSFFSGNCWSVGERILPPLRVDKDENHQHTCLLIQKDKL